MQRTPVASSNVVSIGYDEPTQTLEIEFNGAAVYQYHGVPPSLHHGLMSASSKGSFIHAHIRGRYGDHRV